MVRFPFLTCRWITPDDRHVVPLMALTIFTSGTGINLGLNILDKGVSL